MTITTMERLRRSAGLLAAVLFLLSFAAPSTVSAQASDPSRNVETLAFSDDDPEMNAAIAGAQATLSEFERLIRAHPEARVSVKIAVPYPDDPSAARHKWMQLIDFDFRPGGFVSGVFLSNSDDMPFQAGDFYRAELWQISDWLLMEPNATGGWIHGDFTSRVMHRRVPGVLDPSWTARWRPLPTGG